MFDVKTKEKSVSGKKYKHLKKIRFSDNVGFVSFNEDSSSYESAVNEATSIVGASIVEPNFVFQRSAYGKEQTHGNGNGFDILKKYSKGIQKKRALPEITRLAF